MAKFLVWLKSLLATGLRPLPPNHNSNSVVVRLGQGDYARNYGPSGDAGND